MQQKQLARSRGRPRIGRRITIALGEADRRHLEAVARLQTWRGPRTVAGLVREAIKAWILAHPVGP